MPTYTQQETEILDAIIKVATDYGVDKLEETARRIDIYYHKLGQGSAISQRIEYMMATKYPKTDYTIFNRPSELLLRVILTENKDV